MRRLALIAVPLLFAASPAFAAVARDTTRASCESPRFEAFVLARLPHGRNPDNGQGAPAALSWGPIIDAQTVSNTGHTLSCRLTIDTQTPAGTRAIRGRFTLTIGGENGRTSWLWSPDN